MLEEKLFLHYLGLDELRRKNNENFDSFCRVTGVFEIFGTVKLDGKCTYVNSVANKCKSRIIWFSSSNTQIRFELEMTFSTLANCKFQRVRK